MEEIYGKNLKLIMGNSIISKTSEIQSTSSSGVVKDAIVRETQDVVVDSVYACIRDVAATENLRPIQDSENASAQDMKKMIKTLAKKGWTKNEIVFEMQRIFGNDVLMGQQYLSDERSFAGSNYPSIIALFSFGLYFASRRMRSNKTVIGNIVKSTAAAQQPVNKAHSQAAQGMQQSVKDEVFQKLNIKK